MYLLMSRVPDVPNNQTTNKIEMYVSSKAYVFIGLCLEKIRKESGLDEGFKIDYEQSCKPNQKNQNICNVAFVFVLQNSSSSSSTFNVTGSIQYTGFK